MADDFREEARAVQTMLIGMNEADPTNGFVLEMLKEYQEGLAQAKKGPETEKNIASLFLMVLILELDAPLTFEPETKKEWERYVVHEICPAIRRIAPDEDEYVALSALMEIFPLAGFADDSMEKEMKDYVTSSYDAVVRFQAKTDLPVIRDFRGATSLGSYFAMAIMVFQEPDPKRAKEAETLSEKYIVEASGLAQGEAAKLDEELKEPVDFAKFIDQGETYLNELGNTSSDDSYWNDLLDSAKEKLKAAATDEEKANILENTVRLAVFIKNNLNVSEEEKKTAMEQKEIKEILPLLQTLSVKTSDWIKTVHYLSALAEMVFHLTALPFDDEEKKTALYAKEPYEVLKDGYLHATVPVLAKDPRYQTILCDFFLSVSQTAKDAKKKEEAKKLSDQAFSLSTSLIG
jgi:hypothetical protein